MTQKIYVIKREHRGRVNEVSGTIPELVSYFKYTLECGESWNHNINANPKRITSLIKALNDSVRETQGQCFDPDYYYVD